jgi:hypothetical protein
MRKTNPEPKPLCAVIKLNEPIFPRDFEFKPDALAEAFSAEGLPMGRCFGSKSGYRWAHPDNECVFNANVFCQKAGKIWWGDLDLTRDRPKLEAVARKLRMKLYVLYEGDGRFENADLQHSKVVSLAVWKTGGRK